MNKMLLNLPDFLETERLILRPYRAGDGPAYLDVCLRNKTHLVPFEIGNPALNVQTLEDAEILVREFGAEWIARNVFFLGGWLRTTSEFIVQIYIGVVNWELPEFEIGYFVDCRHEGKGFVTEAVKAAERFCFNSLNAHRIRLGCNEMNHRSQKVAERCGFKLEGHIRQVHSHVLCDEQTYSGSYLYGLLRSEYQQESTKR